MPTANPRINVAVEKSLYRAVHDMAEKSGLSMSMVVRDLMKEAMELREDVALATIADDRMKGFKRSKAVSHKEAWA